MSVGFCAVQWNRNKLVYDGILLAGVALYIASFLIVGTRIAPPKDLPAVIDLRIRAFGSCAFIMLTIILSIGPLARLDRRFLALLYNRRHFGVLTFLVALPHAWFMLEWYAAQDMLPNIITELTTWPDYAKFIGFPFKVLGIAALMVLFLLASTSHDFWLVVLTPPVWKGLHMALYVAYGLVVMHVALGIMQYERTLLVPAMLVGGFGLVAALHLAAGWRERAADRGSSASSEGWIAVGAPSSIPDQGARIVAAPGGERIAVFRDGTQIGALTNLCAHQNGPIGEGRIIDGCVTCPWHGYQYRLADGCAPPPFTEKLATYRVRIRKGVVEVDPNALPPGTPAAITWVPGAACDGAARSDAHSPNVVTEQDRDDAIATFHFDASVERLASPSMSTAQQNKFKADFYGELASVKNWSVEVDWLGDIPPALQIFVSADYRISKSLVPAWYGHRGHMEFPAWRAIAGEAAIAHELVHVYFPNGNRLLAEGLAIYLQAKIGGNRAFPNFGRPLHELAREVLREMVPEFACGDPGSLAKINLADLDGIATPGPLLLKVGRDFYNEDAYGQARIYPIAGSFVRCLIETHGVDKFRALYTQTPLAPLECNAGSPDRWLDVYGLSLAELEDEWKSLIVSCDC